MLNLNETPEAVMTMKYGDKCQLDGRELIVDTRGLSADKMVLTTMDSNFGCEIPDSDGSDYATYYRHVRAGEHGFAVLDRSELVSHLKAGTYSIS